VNLSFFIVLIIIFFILFLCFFDIFQLYIAREETKNAADACALSVVQNLLFFNEKELILIAEKICKENNCEIDFLEFSYDKAAVGTKKKIRYIFLKDIIKENIIYSFSEGEIIFPWDFRFNVCKKYRFEN